MCSSVENRESFSPSSKIAGEIRTCAKRERQTYQILFKDAFLMMLMLLLLMYVCVCVYE